MTVRLALDAIEGHALAAGGTGIVVGINGTLAGLRAAGFTTAKGYTGVRRQDIDETDADKFPADATVGWYLHGGKLQFARPRTFAEQVAFDILGFQNSVLREERDIERIKAQEALAPHTDSGHLWSDDVIHAIAKPHIRLLEGLLATAKTTPNADNIAAYATQLAVFNATALDPGLLGIYKNATKSVWRPKRDGLFAYGYDTATGGVRQAGDPLVDVRFPVTYPQGQNVVTWDALAAVEAL